MVSRVLFAACVLLFALGLQVACDVERDLGAERFTCEAGGTCGSSPDGGVRRDASEEEYDAGWPVDLDGLIPDFGPCFPLGC